MGLCSAHLKAGTWSQGKNSQQHLMGDVARDLPAQKPAGGCWQQRYPGAVLRGTVTPGPGAACHVPWGLSFAEGPAHHTRPALRRLHPVRSTGRGSTRVSSGNDKVRAPGPLAWALGGHALAASAHLHLPSSESLSWGVSACSGSGRDTGGQRSRAQVGLLFWHLRARAGTPTPQISHSARPLPRISILHALLVSFLCPFHLPYSPEPCLQQARPHNGCCAPHSFAVGAKQPRCAGQAALLRGMSGCGACGNWAASPAKSLLGHRGEALP